MRGIEMRKERCENVATLHKVLIWIGSVVASFLALIFGDSLFNAFFPGYGMGYIIDFALISLFWFFLPKRLCAKVDVKDFEKRAELRGMTPGEYASSYFPPSLLALCEANKNDTTSFEKLMKQCIQGESISKADANVLRYIFF